MLQNSDILQAQVHAVLGAFFFEPQNFRTYHHLFDETWFFNPLDRWLFRELKRLDAADEPLDESLLDYGDPETTLMRREYVLEVLATNPTLDPKTFPFIAKELRENKRRFDYLKLSNKLEFGEISLEKFESQLESLFAAKIRDEPSKIPKNSLNTEILSPYLKSAFLNLKTINNYPDSMVLATLLSALGGLIGARAKIWNAANVRVYPVVWSLIIAPSSVSAKSTLFECTKKLVFGDIEKEFERDYHDERKKWSETPESERTEPPVLKQMIFPIDSTPEARIKALMNNQNGGVVFHDEFKAELEKCNANLAYKALKTSLFDGRKYKKELVSTGALILQHPCLSEVGAITQNWLFEAFQKSDIASGFLARYLMSYNTKQDFEPLQSKPIKLQTTEFVDVSKRFYDCFGFERENSLEIELDAEALAYYREWFNELSKTAYETESDEELTITYRLTTYALKFALISFVMNHTANYHNLTAVPLKLSLDYLKEGIAIMDFFRAESDRALRAFKESGRIEIDMDSVLQRIYKRLEKEEIKIMASRKLIRHIKGLTREILNQFIQAGQLKEENINGTNFISRKV